MSLLFLAVFAPDVLLESPILLEDALAEGTGERLQEEEEVEGQGDKGEAS